jgi:lipoyl(octanoyl) transferase
MIEFDHLIDYDYGIELQKKAFDLVRNSDIDCIILVLQHKSVLTTGSGGGNENLLVSKETLKEMGIDLYTTNRGGNVTYHGPGQMVAYPVMDLTKFKKDSHWYLRQLEEVVIQTMEKYGVTGGRKPKYTGVWVRDKKIAAIGVHVKKWITMHGFAFNLSVDKSHFDLINPCGIKEFGIASLDDYIENIRYSDVIDNVKSTFEEVFEMDLKDGLPNLLDCFAENVTHDFPIDKSV